MPHYAPFCPTSATNSRLPAVLPWHTNSIFIISLKLLTYLSFSRFYALFQLVCIDYGISISWLILVRSSLFFPSDCVKIRVKCVDFLVYTVAFASPLYQSLSPFKIPFTTAFSSGRSCCIVSHADPWSRFEYWCAKTSLIPHHSFLGTAFFVSLVLSI